ncbi:acyl-CoA dehydrogenase family protein [Henriciella pelagia]|jgi:indole-3-acetate monooxygenase|uniref:Acyl-CoA dehydrogenase n=1 Tax=Henriciella pelagia TaxID=1977912 RepID=A0ABQ1JI62_9PROT|nr:acyl-CoA dehydrogenase family protein [Henriciella pelagia]GGB67393.1 hypothetical protein GCM10011503_15230 [Henriciella pelagia]
MSRFTTAANLVAQDPVIAQARKYRDELGKRADEIEQLRKLPQDIADRFANDGFYTICNPVEYGGAGASPLVYAGLVEELARGDASAAWCAFIAITSAFSAANGDTPAIKSILNTPGTILSGVFAPNGRARKETVDGVEGYRISGRWAWGSGSQNAHWISGGCFILDDNDKLVMKDDGRPQHLSAFFAASDVNFIDTWTVTGLQGTGSTDYEVKDVFVPKDRAFLRFGSRSLDYPIFKFPQFGMLAIGIGAVALGAAREAIEDFQAFAGIKVPQGNRRTLAEKAGTQRDISMAEATLRQGRAFFYEALGEAWESAIDGEVSIENRRDVRLATTAAVQSAKTAVDLIYELAGGTSVYRNSPIQRRFRDIHVATQHMMVSKATYELTGRLFLGLPTDIEQL